jgi:hypothetical protein
MLSGGPKDMFNPGGGRVLAGRGGLASRRRPSGNPLPESFTTMGSAFAWTSRSDFGCIIKQLLNQN